MENEKEYPTAVYYSPHLEKFTLIESNSHGVFRVFTYGLYGEVTESTKENTINNLVTGEYQLIGYL
jgi:hypothetical protein